MVCTALVAFSHLKQYRYYTFFHAEKLRSIYLLDRPSKTGCNTRLFVMWDGQYTCIWVKDKIYSDPTVILMSILQWPYLSLCNDEDAATRVEYPGPGIFSHLKWGENIIRLRLWMSCRISNFFRNNFSVSCIQTVYSDEWVKMASNKGSPYIVSEDNLPSNLVHWCERITKNGDK